jgi:putative ABC transport system permease protein
MFFMTYLRRELFRRMRQAVFIAAGLALGVGLVVTVSAASAGVRKAQSSVLSALDGVGTDVTVTGAAPGPPSPSAAASAAPGTQEIQLGPNGPETCNSSGKCTSMAGKTQENLTSDYTGISASKLAAAGRLDDVAAAVGAIALEDVSVTFPKSGSSLAQPKTFTVDGVDTARASLGPLSSASLASGHSFTAAESDSYVAVVDSGYARSNDLKAGSALTIDHATYTVIGIVSQPEASNPPDVYIPLARAQAMSSVLPSALKDEVNTIYLTAASAADIPTVSKEISALLPGTTVTTASSLASEATGSVTSAASLADNLGRWLSVLVLIAAFAVASLLTMAAVARRAREFGTLKAIGWRSRRIVGQVLGESVALGIAGAAAGVGLGFAGAAIIAATAPKLHETTGGNSGGSQTAQAGAAVGGRTGQIGGSLAHTVSVPLHPSVTPGVIVLAVILAVAGGLLAGVIGSWRISRLRPADALARVA